MFGSDLLDVLIGLFLVYFLFSLLCTGVNELIIGHLARLRAKMLEQGVSRLLADTELARQFFAHPLISGLAQQNEKRPAYIPARTFVSGLMAVLDERLQAAGPDPKTAGPLRISSDLAAFRAAVNGLGAGPAAKILLRLIADAADLAEARQRLEQWFNDGMDRVSGWYKRTTQWWLVVWAALFVAAFNVDSISITQVLLNNSKLRAVLVAAAQETVRTPPVTPPTRNEGATNITTVAQSSIRQVAAQIQQLNLPLGWSAPPEDWFLKICGLLLSVGALSLGAPFWFDLLNKAVNLRAGGKPPESGKTKKE